ncbi:hypothetical protein Droror1_Dr00028099 [Drosera rotundifolia]
MDGTFNQSAPLDRLAGTSGTVYSIDLKAATDRWPLLLMFEIVQSLFDRSFASSAVNSALGLNIFEISFVNRKVGKPPPAVSFIAGQPLGYYSSWPLFALSHHFVIWYAAELLYPGRKFDRIVQLQGAHLPKCIACSHHDENSSGGVDNWTVRCKCGSGDDDGERMVACDIWQHTRSSGLGDNETVPQSLCALVVVLLSCQINPALLRASKLQDQKWKWED